MRTNLIFDPTEAKNCSFHGAYVGGTCLCESGYAGLICQYDTAEVANQQCTITYDCYNCGEYSCFLTTPESIVVCDSVHEQYKVHDTCRNISVACFAEYDCQCPGGLALLGSDCFRGELVHRIGFFLIIMAVLTVFSAGFELLVHFLEHYLAHHHQKGLLSIVHGFKSELTLIGLIGLILFLLASTSDFEHLLETLQGSEEVIEGVHFLMFFFVIVYFFVLMFSLIVTKVFISRTNRDLEKIHYETRVALIEGQDYKERAMEVAKQVGANKFFKRRHAASYHMFRQFFFISAKTKFSHEELYFFPFDEYMNLCLNDLMSRISGGTWIIWIAFSYYFLMDVYLKSSYGFIISRVSVTLYFGIANAFVAWAKVRMQNFVNSKQPALNVNINEENVELLHQNPEEVRIANSYYKFFACSKPKLLEILTQIALWFAILNAFVIVFDNDASWPMLVTALLLAFVKGAYIYVYLAPLLAGLLYAGPKLNVQFVKEVLKRHPQTDKIMRYREYILQKANAHAPALGGELQGVVQN